MGEIIRLCNLTKYYTRPGILQRRHFAGVGAAQPKGRQRGIENLTLQVQEGEIFGFIGPNGAGKSTTIRTMLGLLQPDGGTAELFGKSIQTAKTEILRRVGYLPSEPAFYGSMKVGDALQFAASFYGEDCRSAARELCERFKLDTEKRVQELSLGNRKKVSIVCAFQHSASLYVLDEPTSGLDPLMQKEFFGLLREKNREGAAIFLSSHVLNEIQRYCSRAAVIRDGSLVVCDDVANICSSSFKRVTIHGVEEVKGIPVRNLQKTGDGISFLYSGPAQELIAALQGLPVKDLTITEPPLEDVFLHFYDTENTASV